MINSVKLDRVIEAAKAKAANSPSWLRAIDRAAEQLRSNPYIADQGDGLLILSTSGEFYHANGVCQCKAFHHGMACWHRAAAQLIKRYNEMPDETPASKNNPLAGVLIKPQGNGVRIDGWMV